MLPVLIAGAGFSGGRLAAQLHAAGVPVITTRSRPPETTTPWPTIVAPLGGDPELADLRAALSRAPQWRVVCTVPPDPALSDSGAVEPRLDALLNAVGKRAERVIYASTTGVYGDHGGDWVTETAAVAPRTRRAKARVAAEKTLARWAEQHLSRTTVLRIVGIYGPGRLPLENLREGIATLDDQSSGPGNRIHVDDLVRCYRAALDHPAPPPIVNCSDGDHRSTTEFQRDVAALAQLPPPQTVDLATARQTFSPMRLSFLEESRRIDNALMRHELGVTLAYADPRDGIRASLATD
ncbi:MAG: NAD-dependent epimerase/dehydratase family protein [Pseudomonadota bacterium]